MVQKIGVHLSDFCQQDDSQPTSFRSAVAYQPSGGLHPAVGLQPTSFRSAVGLYVSFGSRKVCWTGFLNGVGLSIDPLLSPVDDRV